MGFQKLLGILIDSPLAIIKGMKKSEKNKVNNLALASYPHLIRVQFEQQEILVIEGTQIPISYLVEDYYRLNQSVDALRKKWRHLKPALILSALAYYYDHPEEIERVLNTQLEEVNLEIAKSLYPDKTTYEYIQHQGKLFDERRLSLLPDYEGYYVYFEDGQVLEADKDEEKLLDLVEEKYGLKPMFIEKVKKTENV